MMGIAERNLGAAAALGADSLGPVVKSAGRALQILEFFDGVQREASVSEISRALNYPQSSTSVLLRSLVSMGYLQQDRTRRTYVPTRRVSLLGNWVDPSLMQQGKLLDTVEELARKSGQTVVMATANGLYVQYIYVARSTGMAQPPIGSLRPITSVAVGRALLSIYEDGQLTRLLRRINAERQEHAEAIAINDFVEKLRADRSRGYFRGSGADTDQAGIAIVLDRDRQLLVLGIEGDVEHIEGCDQRLSMLRGSTEKICGKPLSLAH